MHLGAWQYFFYREDNDLKEGEITRTKNTHSLNSKRECFTCMQKYCSEIYLVNMDQEHFSSHVSPINLNIPPLA